MSNRFIVFVVFGSRLTRGRLRRAYALTVAAGRHMIRVHRACFSLYWPGFKPTYLRKVRVKWLWDEKPR